MDDYDDVDQTHVTDLDLSPPVIGRHSKADRQEVTDSL